MVTITAALGCGVQDATGAATAAGGSTGTAASESASSEGAAHRDDPEAPPPDVAREDAPGAAFIQDPDGGSAGWECSPSEQDCPDGMKCTLYPADGHAFDSGSKCAPVVDDPSAPGEPCVMIGAWDSGIDSCERGAMCWNVDRDTLEGTCFAYCEDPALLLCPAGTFCADSRHLALCVPFCCPVEQTCAAGQGCYAMDGSFACVEDASDEAGGFRDPCMYINTCDPGLLCVEPDAVPGCEGAQGCCTRFCNVTAAGPCEPTQPRMQCAPFFTPGGAPPGFEDVGVCVGEA